SPALKDHLARQACSGRPRILLGASARACKETQSPPVYSPDGRSAETTVNQQTIRREALEAKWAAEERIAALRECIAHAEAAVPPVTLTADGLVATIAEVDASSVEPLRAQLLEQERRLQTMNRVLDLSEARTQWVESAAAAEHTPAALRFLQQLGHA